MQDDRPTFSLRWKIVLIVCATAGLSAAAKELGCHVIWRCHVGRDTPTPVTDVAWAFLRPHIEAADAAIFSRREYAPDWVHPEKVWVIPPSLDPFTAKNAELDPAVVDATLCRTGLVGLAVTLIAGLAVLRVDCACESDALPVVGAPTDIAAILKTIERRRDGDRLTLEYRTSTPVHDCTALGAEVPRVWALTIEPLLDARTTRHVVLWIGNAYEPPVNGVMEVDKFATFFVLGCWDTEGGTSDTFVGSIDPFCSSVNGNRTAMVGVFVKAFLPTGGGVLNPCDPDDENCVGQSIVLVE